MPCLAVQSPAQVGTVVRGPRKTSGQSAMSILESALASANTAVRRLEAAVLFNTTSAVL